MASVDSPWLTRREAAEYLRVSVATLDRLAHDGQVPRHYLRGGVPRFRRDELDRIPTHKKPA